MLTPPRSEDACFYLVDWNYAVGCTPVDPSCRNCALQTLAGTYPQFKKLGVTRPSKRGPVWNKRVYIYPLDHPVWQEPLLPPPARASVDPDKPLICAVNIASDPFHEAIPEAIIRLAFATMAASPYTALYLTKRPERAAKIIAAASPDEQRLWKAKSIIGISAGDQKWFDKRWAVLKLLALDGWAVCASLAPLIKLIVLPQDYVELSAWTIVYGEQTKRKKDARPCDPDWLRAIVKQCHAATPPMPVFIRQMSGRRPIPFDLLFHEYPTLPIVGRSQVKELPLNLTEVRHYPLHLPTVPSSGAVVAAHRIINLRQTSAAGKTTIIRKLIERVGAEPQYGIFGPTRPEAMRLRCERPLYALGPYPVCGADAVISKLGVKGIITLLEKYAPQGDVIFEALIISSMYGTVGEWLKTHSDSVTIAVLDVSLEQCRAGLAERQGDARKTAARTQAAHYHNTLKVAERMKREGMRVENLDREAAVETILDWLR